MKQYEISGLKYAAIAFACLLVTATLATGSRQALAQTTADGPPWPAGQTHAMVLDGRAAPVGHYDSNNKLRLSIVLALPHQQEEEELLEQLQDKTSPLFHQFLSSEEWDARFAPSAGAEQAIVDWATSQGLTVTQRYPGRLAVDVEGPAGVIEKALHLNINSYQLPATEGDAPRTAYANDHDPVVPARIRSYLLSILGLNSIEVFRAQGGNGEAPNAPDYVPGPSSEEKGTVSADATPGAETPGAGQGVETPGVNPPSPNAYSPADLLSSAAYDYQALMNQGHCCNPLNNPGHSPRETSIAIAAYGDVSFSDIAAYRSAFPNLAYYIVKTVINGGHSCQDVSVQKPDNQCVETTLDTEWALATSNSQDTAADTAKVHVYEGTQATPNVIVSVLNHMVSDDDSRIMSTSWGGEEEGIVSTSSMQSIHNVYAKMAGEGWTLVALSGDQGATAGCGNLLAVQYPASDPLVVGVGGTLLNEGSNTANYEVAWTGGTNNGSCAGNGGGSGGGLSFYWNTPGYQKPLGFSSRAVPDIAIDAASGHDVFYHGNWYYPGGTSISTPMIAGFFAQNDAYLLSIGDKCGANGHSACAPIGVGNYALYSEGLNHNGPRVPFYDIVTGCNSNDVTAQFSLEPECAGPGYDPVTGWGSANMLQLAWNVNFYYVTANGAPYVSFTGPQVNKWYNSNKNVFWTIEDFLGSDGGSPTGIAGFTQGWDTIPEDPYSEPSGGTGDSFYSGPQFVNASIGCLAFNADGCAGGAGQGCHTVWVEGWNNFGASTGAVSYGPLCYDNVPPVTKATLIGTLAGLVYTTAVQVEFTATDATSGVKKTYYVVDGGKFSLYQAYAGGFFSVTTSGTHTIKFYSVDNAGNVEAVQSVTFTINLQAQTQQPAATPVFGSPSGTYNNQLNLGITDATSNAVIYYTVNGSAPTTSSPVYAGPIALAPGFPSATYLVQAIAVAPGYSSSPIAVGTFSVDQYIQ